MSEPPALLSPDDPVVRWLLDADPSIRWQVRRDLLGDDPQAVAAERARVAEEGWGARLLDLQQADGNWGGGPWVPRSWASTFETLMLLRELGLDPDGPRARAAIERVRDNVDWGPEWNHSPFFEGEVEPCINGRALACGAYFGAASERLLARLLGEQLPDGGWNCDAPPSDRSSFNTTICVLEGLLAYTQAKGPTEPVSQALQRGTTYLLERRLCRSLKTGDTIACDRKSGRDWRTLSFPTRWQYDLLWGLDFLRRAGVGPDERTAEAIGLVRDQRQGDGRWLLGPPHAGAVHFELEGPAGTASRWITLRALRVLHGFPEHAGATP